MGTKKKSKQKRGRPKVEFYFENAFTGSRLFAVRGRDRRAGRARRAKGRAASAPPTASESEKAQ